MLTPRIERYVRGQFGESDAPAVLDALRDWRISYETDPPDERLIAAVLFVADGRHERLPVGFQIAEQDWRDLLMAGGIANEDWPAVLDSRLGPATP